MHRARSLPLPALALLALLLLAACGGDESGSEPAPTETAPLRGLLQFRVVHNLEDDACLATNDCMGTLEADEDTAGWLEDIEAESNMAVLHWDRAVPWLAFAEDAPDAASRVSFYDGRLDGELLGWLDAFAEQFARLNGGYLAVSMLHGNRQSLEYVRMEDGQELPVGGACPDFSPSSTFDVGGSTFELGQSYANFLLYLHDKLGPTRMALMVEINILLSFCPGSWDSIVALYRHGFDAVRAEAGPGLPLFATMVLPQLLGHDEPSCTAGGLNFTVCGQQPDAPPTIDAATCYPVDRRAIDDLSAGDRLDVLALSFYPDALSMAFPEDDGAVLELYTPAAFAAGDSCTVHARFPQQVDPFAAIDRIGWDGPIAYAETSARGCPTYNWANDGVDDWVAVLPGNAARQRWFMNALLADAESRSADFVVWSFLRDYAPIGPWVVEQGIVDPASFNVLNIWTCSGLHDQQGASKPGVTERWRRDLALSE